MKRNKIAMLLAMALTVTQSVAVPVAAEELTADAGQEVEMSQDDADAEVAVEADEDASEEVEAEIQDDTEELQDEDFAAEEDLSDGTAQETFSDDAGEKRYEFGWNYDDSSSNTGYMLPNSTMNISTWLDCVDGDDWNEISEYSLKLLPMENGYAGMATVSLNGKEIVVKSGSKAGDITIPVEVLVDGKTVATEWIWVGISEYVIEP